MIKKNNRLKPIVIFLVLILAASNLFAGEQELITGWKCIKADKLAESGENISNPNFNNEQFVPAVVPGTVLQSLLLNKLIPDPYYGWNNEKIKDIALSGPNEYTYWFINDFETISLESNEQAWLLFRGVNYSFDLFVNGHKLEGENTGMFLRHSFNISSFLNSSGHNRLAVLVHPPTPAGSGNGGQGGDGMIAHNVTNQFVAGWDWIQAIRDRNTGIWDKVSIQICGPIRLLNPQVITKVPGIRNVAGKQEPAILTPIAELENYSNKALEGFLEFEIDGKKSSLPIFIPAGKTSTIKMKEIVLNNPKLWWPNGFGNPFLYPAHFQFTISGQSKLSDCKNLLVGVREVQAAWNNDTKSRELRVNGKKIFIKGANWICSDALLQLNDDRYDAQIRLHRDMNLNMVRVWGGGITERPEFYNACDKYGIMVFQEFWISGDCNGRWYDPLKKEDTLVRRDYPDDHALFISSAADQIKMLRNHPSLVFWCGGNEIRPPADILHALKDSLIPQLDGTRYFFNYSNDDSMSFHSGDGPYTIQKPEYFWEHHSFPFNSEIGSVGIGDMESLERFIPKENLHLPETVDLDGMKKIDSLWKYHKYISYENAIDAYGKPKDINDFCRKAQMVNYMQYKSLMEGFSAHSWSWYTGFIIWKTSNPWTALVGEMYDHNLDPNACLYGTKKGGEGFHIMYCPIDSTIMIINNTDSVVPNFEFVIKAYDISGKETILGVMRAESSPNKVMKVLSIRNELREILRQSLQHADFLRLQVLNTKQECIADNFYWLPDSADSYLRLNKLPMAKLKISITKLSKGKFKVNLANEKNKPVAFFNRLSVTDKKTKKRLLPVFYSDNYISICPGEEKNVILEYKEDPLHQPQLCIEGWNFIRKYINLN